MNTEALIKTPSSWFLVNVTIKPEWQELAIDYVMNAGCDAAVETPTGFQCAFPENADGEKTINEFRQFLTEMGAPNELAITTIVQTDWNANWKQFFKPVHIGEHLWVFPEWETIDAPAGDLVIRMRPAMAFGTGTHETTQLCMKILEHNIRGGEVVLDIGAGSGILGMTAIRLGAEKTVGIEIDPDAKDNFWENAELNQLTGQMELQITGTPELAPQSFDIIVVNMIQTRLESALPQYWDVVKPSGKIIISGVLSADDLSFRKFLEHSPWQIVAFKTQNEWIGYQCIVN